MLELYWLGGAAPTFDADVTTWLDRKGICVHLLNQVPLPRRIVPFVSGWLRRRRYRARLPRQDSFILVLPYLAGDAELLSSGTRAHTLAIALGSDLLRRSRSARRDRLLRSALSRYRGVWAVSTEVGLELKRYGRGPDWVAAVGVDLSTLPARLPPWQAGRILSARRDGAVYRRAMIRDALEQWPDLNLVEANDWPRQQLFDELAKAELVISLAESDGAPATVMEALCLGAHVAASGGETVRRWLEAFGGTYGEPRNTSEAQRFLAAARERARAETPSERFERANRARPFFDRNKLLEPLEGWVSRARAASG